MRTLAIDTATEACSVALFEGDRLLAHEHHVLGRGHAERLVPMIASLPGKGQAERILVSLGPGSFTGVRIGIATARALGVAWGAQVLGYPTLSLVAAQALHGGEQQPVTVCVNGGHGEWFVQNFDGSGAAEDAVRSLSPDKAAQDCRHPIIAGNRAAQLAELVGDGFTAHDLLPDASLSHLLRSEDLTGDLSPIYGRGPDANLPS